MKVIKMLGAALLSCIALVSVNASADVQQVPVSCGWSVVSSYGPPDNSWRDIVRECNESNGTLVATQSFRGFSGGGTENCSLSVADDINYTGACMSPSFTREEWVSSCTTPGMRVHGGCANSFNEDMLSQPHIQARCGTGCSLEFQTIGWTSACPYVGHARSPEYGIFCK